jgi:CheY-like chemotaxis protein
LDKETILVVDDETVVLEFLGKALHKHGYDFILAASGEEACKVFA